MKTIIERCEYVAAKMSDGEIRRLADGCGIDSKFRTVMLAYIGMLRRNRRVADTAISLMVELCNEVNHDIIRDIGAMNGYTLNVDAKDFVKKIDYILRGDAGKGKDEL